MEEGSQGDVLVYTLRLEEGGEECLCLSIEVLYVRVSVRPREGSRLSLLSLPPLHGSSSGSSRALALINSHRRCPTMADKGPLLPLPLLEQKGS